MPGDVVLLRWEAGYRPMCAWSRSAITRIEGKRPSPGNPPPVGKHVERWNRMQLWPTAGAWPTAGTSITSGSGRGGGRNGEDSEVGRIGLLVQGTQQLSTPLTQRLDRLARQITAFTLVVGVAVFAASYLLDRPSALDSFLAVVGLAVAAIPEAIACSHHDHPGDRLPVDGQQRAIVRRLPAVETLGRSR